MGASFAFSASAICCASRSSALGALIVSIGEGSVRRSPCRSRVVNCSGSSWVEGSFIVKESAGDTKAGMGKAEASGEA